MFGNKILFGNANCKHKFKKQGNTLKYNPRTKRDKVTGGYFVCSVKGCNATKYTKGGAR